MFNLIPQDLKEEIKKDYKLKRLILIFLFIIFVEVSLLIFLFPTWLISFYKEKDVVSRSKEIKDASLGNTASETINTIKSLNSKLGAINNTLEYPKLNPLVKYILSKKTSFISINRIVYTRKGETAATMNLGGVSATRESLLSFVKSLEDGKVFKKVDLPISNFAKDRNLNFSINISIE